MHHSLFRRLLSVLLCLTMIFSLFPVSVFAEGLEGEPAAQSEQSGKDSVNLKIDFVSEDGAALAEAYTLSVAKGAAFEGTVPFAPVEGYRPAKVEFGAVNAANASGEEGVISVYGECANVLVTENGMVLSGSAEADVYVIVTYVALAAAAEEEQPAAKDAVRDALGRDTLALGDYGVAPLADKITLEIGEKKTLDGNNGSNHSWTSSNKSVATVSDNNSETATVTCVASGTVTITHKYTTWRGNNRTETWTVTVNEAAPATGTTRVYVYLKVEGTVDPSATVNALGWYTIGYVDVEGLPAPSGFNIGYYNDAYFERYVKPNIGNIVLFEDNKGLFDLTDVVWLNTQNSGVGLKVAAGATDYGYEVPAGTKTWHLDGYLKIVEKHKLNVNYVCEDGGLAGQLPNNVSKEFALGGTYRFEVPSYEGYTVSVTEDGAPFEGNTVTMGNKDRTITVTYTRNAYTVTGTIDNGGKVNDVAGSSSLTVNSGEGASLSFVPAEGYKISSITVNGVEQKITDTKAYTYNNTSVTKDVTVVVKTEIDDGQTKTLSYTVEYYKDGVKVEGDTQTVTETVQVLRPDTLTVKQDEINTNKYNGYKFVQTDPATIPETVESGAVIKVYYTARNDLSYTVRYLEKDTNEVVATEKTVDNQIFGSTVTESAIDIDGYNKVYPISATITIAETGNEITFYYTKRNDLSYTVNHILVNGAEESNHSSDVVYNQTFGTVITSADEKIAIPGYTFDHADKDTLTVGTGENVINLYYTINSHTVTYKVDGEQYGDVENYQYNTEVTVADAPESKEGYKFSGWTTKDAAIENGEFAMPDKDVVITGQYIVDGNQTKNLSATVDYKLGDDVQTDARINLSATVQVLEPDTLSTKSVSAKEFKGWKLSNITVNGDKVEELPAAVNNGDEVFYNYVKDTEWTQDTKYTVKHVTVLDGVETEQTADTKTYTGKAWVNDDPAMIAIQEGSLAQKSYKGYTFSSISVDEKVTEVETDTVITLKYVKNENATKTLSYTVQYYKDSVKADSEVVTKSVWVNDSDTLTVDKGAINTTNKYTGYKLDSENTGIIPDTVNSDAIINVYYVKDESVTKETVYTVHYTINDVEQENDKLEVKGTAWVNDDPAQIAIAEGGIPAPADKYEGYKLDSKNPAYPTAGTKVNSGSEYTVNYVKDDNQTQSTKYTVHYTINGVEQENDKLEVTGTAWVLDNPAQIAIAEGGIPAPEDKYPGYKLDENNSEYPAAGTMVDSDSEFTVNYVKDDSQTQTTKYTVRHVVEGVEQVEDTKTYESTAWVNDDPAMIAIVDRSLDAKNYTGYKLDTMTYADGKPVADDTQEVQTDTVITLTYIKDDGQTQGTSYTVKHVTVLNGVETEQTADTYTGTAWVNDDPAMIAIQEGSLAENEYTGYKFDSISVAEGTAEVKSGTVITLKYVKDENATQPTEYTVKHVVEGVEQVNDTKTYESTAWVNDNPAMIAIVDRSLDAKNYTGYKLNSISVAEGTAEVESGTTITLTYVKDDEATKTNKYTVQHVTVVNNKETVQDTQTYEKKVWVNDPDTIAIVDGSLAEKSYLGYKFDSMSAVIGEEAVEVSADPKSVESGTVITLKYVVDMSQTKMLEYTVEYYKNDTLAESETFTSGPHWINATNNIKVDMSKENYNTVDKFHGYTFDRVEGSFVGQNKDYVHTGSTIRIYYTANTNTQYEVVHHFQNIDDDYYTVVDRETLTGTTDTKTNAAAKDEEGFTAQDFEQQYINGDGSTVVDIYYTRNRYTVTYQYEGFVPADATALPETVSYKHGAAVSVESAASAYGYTFTGWDRQGEFTMPMENVAITGKFEPISGIKYTVKYVDEAGNPVGRGTMDLYNGVFGETVTQRAIAVTGYKLLDESKATQSLVIGLNPAENVITFVYAKQSYKLTVNYIYAEDGSEAAPTVEQTVLYDNPYEVVSPVIEGYTVDKEVVSSRWMPSHDVTVTVSYTARTDLSYTVNYLEQGTNTVLAAPKTVTDQTFGASVTETPVPVNGFVAPEAQTIEIAVEDNVINFYYTRRTDLTYTVNYLEAGTNNVLAPAATVAGQTFGSTVTVNPIVIAGYATPAAQNITIAVTGNVINFYYAAIPVIPGNPVVDIPPIPQLPENIDDEITPLDGPQVTVDDPEIIDDEATPLAEGEHLCCILHFLILCAALLIELIYVSDSKKRQQKIFDMRRELNK